MINVATSYFYQIRFFKPYMVPISTAVWDPKWYHNFKGQDHVFVDKNGVINGLRIKPLMPGHSCDGLCRGRENCETGDPGNCPFLEKYYEQLAALDFNQFMDTLEEHVCGMFKRCNLLFDPLVVFIVHEAISNPCSERVALLRWFNENGLPVTELRYPISSNY